MESNGMKFEQKFRKIYAINIIVMIFVLIIPILDLLLFIIPRIVGLFK
jgi:hypothetical protein